MTTRARLCDADTLGPHEPRAGVVLTFSGSLLWLGAPEGAARRRRYVYQSIYGTGAPR